MSDQDRRDARDTRDVRDLLGTALRGEPPSTLDPARLMRLGKRRVRLQRASAALGVMVVAGGIAVGASLIHPAGNDQRPGQISTASTSDPALDPAPTTGPGSIAVSPTPVSTPNTALLPPSAAGIIDAQNKALGNGQLLPTGMSVTSGSLAFQADLPTSKGYAGSRLSTRIGDSSGSGDFSMTVVVTNGGANQASCDGSLMNCSVQQIDGITVEIETDHPTAQSTRILTVAGNGDILVNAEVDNLSSANGKTVTRPAPPLSQSTLAKLTAEVAKASL